MKSSREGLSAIIHERLHTLREAIDNRRGSVEEWYANLLTKMLISVAQACQDLLDTIEKETLPAAAWNARNLLELWVWIKYCSASRANAWRFHEDALRDMMGLAVSLSKLRKVVGLRNESETAVHKKLTEVAMANLGVNSINSNYLRVADAAKVIGLENWYVPCNAQLSKFAHPTAGLVIGMMHQDEPFRELQSACT